MTPIGCHVWTRLKKEKNRGRFFSLSWAGDAAGCGITVGGYLCPEVITVIIQPTPNLSVTMPKRGDQKVFIRGMPILPPSANALKIPSTSASVETASESEKPSNLGFSVEQPSEAITMVW